LARSGSQARFSLMWPWHLTPYGSTAFPTVMDLNFPSYPVKTIESYLRSRTFAASFQAATSSRRGIRAGVAQRALISPVLFILYVNEIPVPFSHVELALYADDTAVIATSQKPVLLVS
jgi:hypothetical protein